MAFFRTSDYSKIYYEVHGEGETTVIFSGEVGTTTRFLSNIAERLGRECRVILYDYRGHWHSERTPQPIIKESVATDLKELMEHLGIEHTYLAGWSVGAAVSLAFLEQYGEEKVDGLILMDMSPKPRADIPEDLPLSWYGTTDRYAYLKYLAYMNDEEINPAADSPIVLFSNASEYKNLLSSLQGDPISMPHQIAYTIYYASSDFKEFLKHLTIPVLNCYGGAHTLFTAAVPELLEKSVKNIRSCAFEGCGHAFFLEDPDRFTAVVSHFIEE